MNVYKQNKIRKQNDGREILEQNKKRWPGSAKAEKYKFMKCHAHKTWGGEHIDIRDKRFNFRKKKKDKGKNKICEQAKQHFKNMAKITQTNI